MNEKNFGKSLGYLGVLIFLMLLAPALPAQTNAPQQPSGRFLFVVDTSSAMRRRAPAVQKAVENLLRSSMSAQLRAGDTVGVWTFNEELYTGRFPLQRWSPELTETVASNVVAFLKAQPYQKQSHYEVVAPALERIVKDSYKLTVLLVTDGDEKITGTPFDRQIAGAFAEKFKEQQKARLPFITVLRVSRATYVNASVNLAPWPVEFPAFPPDPKIAGAPKPKPPEIQPAPRPAVPPLMVIGQKPELTAGTNAPTTPTTPVKIEAPNLAVTPTPSQLNSSEIKSASAPILTPTPAEVGTKPAPGPVSESVRLPPSTTLIEPAPVANPPEARSPAVANTTMNEVAPTNQTTPVALAIQPEPGFSRMGMVAIGVALVLLAGGLFFVMQRRARNAAHASLITRSMDRDRK